MQGHRGAAGDLDAGRIEAERRADDGGGQPAHRGAGVGDGSIDLPQQPPVRRPRVQRQGVEAGPFDMDPEIEHLIPMLDPAHRYTLAAGARKGRQLDREPFR